MSPKLFKDLIRMLARSFYDEEVAVIMDYILFNGRIEEHEMAEKMNLPIKHIRKSLNELKNHNFLVAQAGKKDRKSATPNGNMFSRGPDEDRLMYWCFDRDIVNVVKFRLMEVKRMLEEMVTDAENKSYYCKLCQKVFSLNEVMVNKSVCKMCKDYPLSQRVEIIDSAKENQRIGLERLKPLEAQLQECREVVLSPEFFGDFQEVHIPVNPKAVNKHKLVTHRTHPVFTHDGSMKTVEVDVNFAEEDKKEEDSDSQIPPDPDVLNYYLMLPVKKVKKEVKREENTVTVTVEGEARRIQDVTARDEMKMTPAEHADFSRLLSSLQFSLR